MKAKVAVLGEQTTSIPYVHLSLMRHRVSPITDDIYVCMLYIYNMSCMDIGYNCQLICYN